MNRSTTAVGATAIETRRVVDGLHRSAGELCAVTGITLAAGPGERISGARCGSARASPWLSIVAAARSCRLGSTLCSRPENEAFSANFDTRVLPVRECRADFP